MEDGNEESVTTGTLKPYLPPQPWQHKRSIVATPAEYSGAKRFLFVLSMIVLGLSSWAVGTLIAGFLNCGFWGCGYGGKEILPTPWFFILLMGFVSVVTATYILLAVQVSFSRLPVGVLIAIGIPLVAVLHVFTTSFFDVDWKGCPTTGPNGSTQSCNWSITKIEFSEKEPFESELQNGYVHEIGEYRSSSPGEAIERWTKIEGIATNLCEIERSSEKITTADKSCWSDFYGSQQKRMYSYYHGTLKQTIVLEMVEDEYGYLVVGQIDPHDVLVR